MHVLIKGHPGTAETEIGILNPSSGQLDFLTSYQLFYNFVQVQQHSQASSSSHNSNLKAIGFALHSYDLNPFQPLHCVRITNTSEGHEFQSVRQKAAGGAPNRRTPFGLAIKSPRKRKRKTDPKAAAKAPGLKGPKRKASKVNPDGFANLLHKLGAPGTQATSQIESDSAGSTSDSSTESGNSASSDSSVTVGAGFQEEVVQTAEAVLEEKRQADLALRSLETAVDKPQPKPLRPLGQASFCNKTLGLVELGQQVSGKLARCRQCSQAIEKGAARFGYAFHRQKFHGWLHGPCVISYMKQQPDPDWAQALSFIQEARLKDPPYTPTVLAAMCDLETALRHLNRAV